ncbi:contactin-associated protein-like 5 [Clupea harengus]|uniref:Contactin-associated protein-like 5 n=1 Tax=Clupea harengus TaxID=7950 RepID=A0A6P8EVW4_CLUHA|nr:contactin-associated protein-like 5 [Clupea harengus]
MDASRLVINMEFRRGGWLSCSTVLLALASVFGASNYYCEDPLVTSLPPGSFDSSSRFSSNHLPQFAKLKNRDSGGGWSPDREDQHPWLQVDLRERMEVTALATQGRWGSQDWVSQYQLLYSDSVRAWRQYRHSDVLWTFPGNTDMDSMVHHKLPHPIRTRFLRLVPLQGNPRGGMGLRVEVYGCTYKSDVADFDGRSALLYRFNQKSMSTVKDVISLRFRSKQEDGVLVHGEGQRGDYITLELQQGRLILQLNLDDSKPRSGITRSSVTLGSLLDDHHWHSVQIERFSRQVNFTVDHHTQHFRTQGQEDSLEVDYELSFGGIPLPGKPGTFLKENFHGCMENLYYNGVNIIDLAKRRKPQIYSTGNVTFHCSEAQPLSVTFRRPDSFLTAPADLGTESFSVRLQIRTWNREGLIVIAPLAWEPLQQLYLRLILQLQGGRVLLSLDSHANPPTHVYSEQTVSDGQWHYLRVEMKDRQMFLTVDRQRPVISETKLHVTGVKRPAILLFGGCAVSQPDLVCEGAALAFQGCMRLMFANNHPVNLLHVQQRTLGNYSQLDFDVCGIRDRCTPNYCEHGGQCSQSWSQFYCDCLGTGYTGATCHSPLYERSCEAYRGKADPSGTYTLDLDGSGPLESTPVTCSQTEDKVWTVVGHDQTEPVRVRGSTLQSPYTRSLNYSLPPSHLQSLVTTSLHCQQEVIYQCRKSRLFDTWDGTPLSWWLDRDGAKRTYWGGFLPGVQQCSCSLEGNCMDMNYFCNCDADRDAWVNDTGLLSYKDHLPLREIAIGDTNRTGSEVVFKIGPLRCYGNRFLWNSASFYQETSYLHFPPLQAELTLDLSLYFKTSTLSGVLLENLGVQAFIRLELSSPSSVTFIFDLGDGPISLTVSSPVALNDRQWHHVRAERNVKGAWLQVDQLPPRRIAAPPEGRLHLQLSGQLFVGGTASRQGGFQGCLRALTLNGVALDLEERAKTTPGVSPGCLGHCNGDSICHHGGRCVEESNSYVCDCSQTAYGGPHCSTVMAAAFDGGSSLTYSFQETLSGIRDRVSKSSPAKEEAGVAIQSPDSLTLGFQTRRTPTMLLLVRGVGQRYVAIILKRTGSMQIKYRLDEDKEPDTLSPRSSSLSDGKLHWLRLSRQGKDVYVQIDDGLAQIFTLTSGSSLSPLRSVTLGKLSGGDIMDEEVVEAGSHGFIGCLSSVQFNQVAPLKEALSHRSTLVSISGRLSESSCGSASSPNTLATTHSLADHSEKGDRGKEPRKEMEHNESAVIGGVVAAVVFTTLCVMGVIIRFLYQHRRPRPPPAKAEKKEQRANLDPHPPHSPHLYRTELDLHKSTRDHKEYFI